MRLMVVSEDAERRDEVFASLIEDLEELNPAPFQIQLERAVPSEGERISKGDPISISAIVLALVSTGGALTIAVGKEGLLSRIAGILDSYVKNKKIRIKLKSKDGDEVEIVGPPKNIERILSESLHKELKH